MTMTMTDDDNDNDDDDDDDDKAEKLGPIRRRQWELDGKARKRSQVRMKEGDALRADTRRLTIHKAAFRQEERADCVLYAQFAEVK